MKLLVETLGDLWKLLDRRSRWLAILLVLGLAMSGAMEMGSVLFLFGYIAALSPNSGRFGEIYHVLAGGLEGWAFAAVAGVILLTAFALKNAVSLLTSFYLMRFAMKRYEEIAATLFEGFLNTRLELFNLRGTLEAQQVLNSATAVFRVSFVPALGIMSDIVVLVTMVIVFLIVVNAWPVVISAGLLGLGAVVFLALTRRMSTELGASRLKAERALSHALLDGFRGLVDARLGHREGAIVGASRRAAASFALAERRSRALGLVPRALNEMLLAAGIVAAAVYFVTTPAGIQGALPVLAGMGFAGLRMAGAMSRITGAMQQLVEGEPARVRLMSAIRRTAPSLLFGEGVRSEDDYRAEDQPLPPGISPHLTDRITLDRVSFSYPGGSVAAVEEVSLEVVRGSFVGLCGPSGSGKSTLALILMGLVQPQSGRVLCDGWDVFRHVRAWHANLCYVGQAPFISPRSVRENVAFGFARDEIDDAEVWRALETASLADVIRARPEGLDAQIGEEGMTLSGGQRQRLSIARALYRDPDVLVFDEATAALDSGTEKEVSKAIAAMSRTKTVICIAHRLTTIRDCDVIYYVEGGRVADSGTYEELEKGSAGFRRMALGIEAE